MKNVLASLLLIGLAAHAADPTPAPASADEMWQQVEALRKEPTARPKSREELLSILKGWFTSQKEAADAFLAKYPSDPRRYNAEIMSMQSSNQLARLTGTGKPMAPAKFQERLMAIAVTPDANNDAKGEAVFIQAVSLFDDRSKAQDNVPKFFVAAEEFTKKFPDHRLGMQMRQLQIQVATQFESPESTKALERLTTDSDPRVADMAKKVLAESSRKQEMANKLSKEPLDLKFTATDGREIDLAKMRGKVVLVDFWASWCGPCMSEAPNVVATYKKLHDKGFEIVGISLDKDRQKMDQAIQSMGMTWPQYFDGKGWDNEISTRFGIRSIPETWLVDKAGYVRKSGLRGPALEAGVTELLAAP